MPRAIRSLLLAVALSLTSALSNLAQTPKLHQPGTNTLPRPSPDLDAAHLKAGDSASLAVWADASGHGRNGTQARPDARPTYHAADEEGVPYVDFAAGQSMTVPIPQTAMKTIFLVVRKTIGDPYNNSALYFDEANRVYADSAADYSYYTWGAVTSARTGGRTYEGGYAAEWSVVALRQNSHTSASLFENAHLLETFTLAAPPAQDFTRLQLGPGAGQVRRLAVFAAALSDAEIAQETALLLAPSAQQLEYVPHSGAPALVWHISTPALIWQKGGLTGSRPLIILNHAAGETERMWREFPPFRSLADALTDQGYIVAASRLHGDSWGNQLSLDDNAALYRYVVAHYPVDTTRVAMIGDSMGGLATMLAFPDGRIPLRGAALYYPVLDLDFQRTVNGLMRATIDRAYPQGWAGHDPVLRPATDWAGRRVRFYASTADSIVPYDRNAGAMAARLRQVAAEAEVVELNSEHNGHVEQTRDDLLAFLARCFASPDTAPAPAAQPTAGRRFIARAYARAADALKRHWLIALVIFTLTVGGGIYSDLRYRRAAKPATDRLSTRQSRPPGP